MHSDNIISVDFDRQTPNSTVKSPITSNNQTTVKSPYTSNNYPLDKPSEYPLDRPSEWVSRQSDNASKPSVYNRHSEEKVLSRPSEHPLDKPSEYNPNSNYNSDAYKLSDLQAMNFYSNPSH